MSTLSITSQIFGETGNDNSKMSLNQRVCEFVVAMHAERRIADVIVSEHFR